ncbi:MAG: ribosome small subunit-dependent GTPase A [Clostridiales bacterium]|nr:ribosome small subunit-dependent GTPase A [Clostridiales bacterium]
MQLIGTIVKGIGGFYYVEAADSVYECKARGIFRKEKISPLVGDCVEITVNDNSKGTIDIIKPRKSELIRPPIANVDKIFIVASIVEPMPNTSVIDMMTAIAMHKGIEPSIIISKSDLSDIGWLYDIYTTTGLDVFCVSPVTGEGIDAVREALRDHISAFTGNSGVGKSTLLNGLDKGLGLNTGEISEKLGRGRHTTRHVELFKINGGYVADTPGFTSIDIENGDFISKDELPFCFNEFLPYLGKCRFSSCAHINDMGCKIVEAVENRIISKSRHENYTSMYNSVKNIKSWQLD